MEYSHKNIKERLHLNINFRYQAYKFGFCFVFGMTTLMVYTFFLAVMNGGTITISVTMFGELIPEIILVCACIPMVVFSFLHTKNKVLPKIKRGEA